MNTEQLDTGYASLKDESGVTTVHGVAIGEDDVTHGGSGKETLWPRETLEEAAEDLEGAKLATDMDHTAEDPNPQTPVEAIIGEVSWAGYKPGVGVLYEAELGDDDIAEKVENGWLEVSPLVSREVEPLEESDQADFKATKINGWRDLATVAKGAAPSNEIQIGEQTLKAEALSETVHESMAGAHESDSGEETHEALKEVAGVEFDGTAEGKLDETEIEDNFGDHALYGEGENKEDYSYWVVDASGDLRKGNVNSAWQLGCRGQCPSDNSHDENLRALAQEFEDPPGWANDADAMSGAQVKDPALWEACSVSLPIQSDDGENGGIPQSFGGSSGSEEPTETMTDENTLTDDEKAILSAAEDVEDATEALQSFADHEDPEVVEATEYEALNSRVDTLKDMMADRLVEDTGLKEGTVESMSFEAMAKEFETEEGDFDAEALVQNPEAGEPEADESGVEALSDDADVDKAEALYNDYQTFGNERLKDDITEALGVSDFEDAKEVLD